MVEFETHRKNAPSDALFSILIPSWNNVSYLKNCIDSIQKNSYYTHQIIVHLNEGSDGSREWIENQPSISYTFSLENIGVCYALNILAPLAVTEYILYLNDDMYVCPDWDKYLYEEVQSCGSKYFFFSSTAIEWKPQSACSILGDYGHTLETFDENKLLAEYDSLAMNDWNGSTWPPNIVHKDIWNLVGGYSIEFSPGMYSDPDFSRKLWEIGIRNFKGIAKSRVYHFGSLTVKRIVHNKGYYQYISKWKMTSSTFSSFYLKRGMPYQGLLQSKPLSFGLKIKSFFKRLFTIFKLKN